MKPGALTTEFWLTTLFSLYSIFGGVIPAPFNVIIPGVLTGIYTIGRTLVKSNVIKGQAAAILNEIGTKAGLPNS